VGLPPAGRRSTQLGEATMPPAGRRSTRLGEATMAMDATNPGFDKVIVLARHGVATLCIASCLVAAPVLAIPSGAYAQTADDGQSADDPGYRVLKPGAALEVAAESAAPAQVELPATGFPTGRLAAAGICLLVAGAALQLLAAPRLRPR